MLLVFGIAILIGLIFQLVTGYSLMPYGSGRLIDRGKKRTDYWGSIALQVVAAFTMIGLGIYYR